MAKAIKSLELHYPMIKFLMIHIIANRITEKKNPTILVPDQFSVQFMSKKAGKRGHLLISCLL